MTALQQHIQHFRALHVPGDPLVLFNAWDAGSARAIAAAGAPVIATSSWAVAAAQGLKDGENMSLHRALDVARAIVAAVDVPVTADFEAGYAAHAQAVGDHMRMLADTGVAGCNLEDGIAGTRTMRPVAEQVERLQAARSAAPDLFINARTDVFLQAAPDQHGAVLDEALQRIGAYAGAGVDGIFVPGLLDPGLIARVVEVSARPVNILLGAGAPAWSDLARLGVARISHGAEPYLKAMEQLREAAVQALARPATG